MGSASLIDTQVDDGHDHSRTPDQPSEPVRFAAGSRRLAVPRAVVLRNARCGSNAATMAAGTSARARRLRLRRSRADRDGRGPVRDPVASRWSGPPSPGVGRYAACGVDLSQGKSRIGRRPGQRPQYLGTQRRSVMFCVAHTRAGPRWRAPHGRDDDAMASRTTRTR